MEIEWKISSDDVTRIKALLANSRTTRPCKSAGPEILRTCKPEVDREQFGSNGLHEE